MDTRFGKAWMTVAGMAALALAGCGGGGGGTDSTGTTPASAGIISGTVASGAALANAPVAVTNSAGNSPCQEASITTTALGSYTCTLKSGEAAPFFVVVTDPSGNIPALASVATSAPPAGATLTMNVTPLTTAILAQLVPDGNALTLVGGRTVNAAALQQTTANVVAQLANVLAAIGAPAGYDPFKTSITAATSSGTGNTADLILDVVKVVTDPTTGKLALATIDDPTPVPLATAGTLIAAPAAAVSTLSQAAQVAVQALNACFALPTAQRVLTKDLTLTQAQGGPMVTSVATACQKVVAGTDNAAGLNFRQNGYWAGQFFYGLLTSDSMTGAQFSVPEVMLFIPANRTASGQDEAVVSFRYLDADGNPGSIITVARNIPGTATPTRPTNWWLVGNQQPLDVSVRTQIRRVEQLNPANANPARMSTFQTGIQFNINAKGPGSNRAGSPLTFARVSGPGLPGNGAAGSGLVYVRSTGAQNSMDLFSKNGSLTVGSQCGNGETFYCPNLWFARTQGITGAAATTLTANPTGLMWAQTADGVDPTKVVKGARYKIELFYGSNTGTADDTIYKTLLSDLVQPTRAVNLPWNSPGGQTLSALDPNGSLTAAQSALAVDWVQNLAAQQISGVEAVIDPISSSFGPVKGVPRGARSVVLDNVTVPVFDTTNASRVGRMLQFSYRMLDSSIKTATYRYN